MSTQNNANNNEQLLLPGCLGDPERDWRTDPLWKNSLVHSGENPLTLLVPMVSVGTLTLTALRSKRTRSVQIGIPTQERGNDFCIRTFALRY